MIRNIPNTLTCCNLFSGCIASCMAFQSNYVWAFVFIIIGAAFDFFDGMVARLLHVSSPIGKELDSLADDITFGLAPAAIAFALFQEVHYPDFIQMFVLVVVMSLLLVAELPMFSLKFKDLSWQHNKVSYIFLIGCIPLFLIFQWSGFAAVIIWYVILSLLFRKKS